MLPKWLGKKPQFIGAGSPIRKTKSGEYDCHGNLLIRRNLLITPLTNLTKKHYCNSF